MLAKLVLFLVVILDGLDSKELQESGKRKQHNRCGNIKDRMDRCNSYLICRLRQECIMYKRIGDIKY